MTQATVDSLESRRAETTWRLQVARELDTRQLDASISMGFTGTRADLTLQQVHYLHNLVAAYVEWCSAYGAVPFVRHGDCFGADAQFHRMATSAGCVTIGHPGHLARLRAGCATHFTHPPRDTLDRNRDIADWSWLVVACPRGDEEELRSGTWAAVRAARRLHRPVILVLPTDSPVYERIDDQNVRDLLSMLALR
jgi:hypothetical protein